MQWELAKQIDYEPVSNFWEQFTEIEIKSNIEEDDFRDLAETLFQAYKNNIIFLTELILVINHKCWYWFENNNGELAKIYSLLYYEYDSFALNYIEKNMTQKEITYYLRTLD